MPALELFGYRSDVEVHSIDDEGWCKVTFPALGDGGAWMSVHINDLSFGPGEQRPAGRYGKPGELSGRDRIVLSMLARAGYHGLTVVEIAERCNLPLDDARKVCRRLRDRDLTRNSGSTRPAQGHSWAVWEISHHGAHALSVDSVAV